MALRSGGLDYYNKMHLLEERLQRSEEERMLLQRQFDLLMQANQEKERARVSVVEARYKRFLDEDKRRRDRNSSLLQALDRIDSHTASLAAKTERMRALRKHYEAFIAHSYPGWHPEIERSYYPLAAIAPAPNSMTRVTEITEKSRQFPDTGDYSETQYHALPSTTPKPYCSLATPLCRSDLSIASRDACPVVGQLPYRSSTAAIRSASLSPSRVRDLSSQYDANRTSSLRNYDLYPPSRSPEIELSPRLKNDSHYSRRSEFLTASRPSRYLGDISHGFGEDNQTSYRPLSSRNHRILDYDHGNSDIEIEQNTSGDLLNLSNLSLSDDGISNEPELSRPYSGLSHQSYASPRDFTVLKKSPSVSLPLPSTSYRHLSPREVFIPKRSGSLSPAVYASSSPRSILSPRVRKSDIPTALTLSDRLLLSADDLDIRRPDSSLSPRRQQSTWQTYRPSYLQPPTRSTIRRSVTFTEPEFESPCIYRDEDVGLYSGSYGSLRRHAPSVPISSWESSDHEKYLRDKQGRGKDAFREKIERLKELIQENKDKDSIMTGSVHDAGGRSDFSEPGDRNRREKSLSRESSLDRDWKISQSRRPSIARELSSDSEDQHSPAREEFRNFHGKINSTLDDKIRGTENDDTLSGTISDKEQWSGQFSEKDEDAKEELKLTGEQENKLGLIKSYDAGTDLNLSYDDKSDELSASRQDMESMGEKVLTKAEQDSEKESVKSSFESYFNPDQTPQKGGETSDISLMSSRQEDDVLKEISYEEEKNTKEPTETNQNKHQIQEQEIQSNFSSEQKQGDQKNFVEYPETHNYDEGQQQKEWTTNGAQPGLQYTYNKNQPSSAAFEEPNQDSTLQRQESGYEQYASEREQDQQSPRNYQADNKQQSQSQGEFGETEYGTYQEPQMETTSSYQEPKQETIAGYEEPQQGTPGGYKEPQQGTPSGYQESQQGTPGGYQEPQLRTPGGYQEPQQGTPGGYQEPQQGTPGGYQEPQEGTARGYQDFSEDPNQYQQSYPTYSEDQQYAEQQNPNYSGENQSSYQYGQDPTKTQYEYGGQDYNYQQNQDNYNYPQDQNYQQDTSYQQDQTYQQEQGYQDQNYPQDQQYQQDPNYQQGQQYQETAYEGSQQYEGYQPGPDDLSEDTTATSADINYQGQFQSEDALDPKQTLDQYRDLLDADPSSEPAYSDSSELEKQMAAVVGQTGNTATSAVDPTSQAPPPSTMPATAPGKVKAGAKKKPQLTRKQSSITPENVDGKQQATNLPKMQEAQPQSDSDLSSSH